MDNEASSDLKKAILKYKLNCQLTLTHTRCPMAPPGTKVVIHDKPSTQSPWGYHGTLGYYVAPATEHYRCMTCFIPLTRSECIMPTLYNSFLKRLTLLL